MLNDQSKTSLYWQSRLKTSHQQYRDVGTRCEMRCKVCGDSKKSATKARLNFYKSNCTVHCFNCGYDSLAINYIAKVERLPVNELKIELFKDIGAKSYFSNKDKKNTKYEKATWLSAENVAKVMQIWNKFDSKLPQEAIDWCKERKLHKAPFLDRSKEFRMRWSAEHNYLAIPWIFTNKICYLQLRNVYNNNYLKYLFPKYIIRMPFYNLDKVNRKLPYIFICESAIDAVFVKNGIASGTLNISNTTINLLSEMFPYFEFILMPDNLNVDDGTNLVIMNLINKFPALKFFMFPDKYKQYKDVNAIVRGMSGRAENKAIIDFSNLDFLLSNSISAGMLKTKLILRR